MFLLEAVDEPVAEARAAGGPDDFAVLAEVQADPGLTAVRAERGDTLGEVEQLLAFWHRLRVKQVRMIREV